MADVKGAAFLRERWDALRESYWFLPMLMAAISGFAALALIEVDRRLPADRYEGITWLTQVSADGARAVLSTIAGSMITVTGVVFSIMVVALTLTSSQFGPRLLRTFLRDRRSQFVLGTFVSTFIYGLLVLRSVESPERVPELATAGAVGLAIFSLFVLIYYVHHAASSIQASSVIASVAVEIAEQIEVSLPEPAQDGAEEEPAREESRPDDYGQEAATVLSPCDGYVRFSDLESLYELACEKRLRIALLTQPGEFVTVGTPLAHVSPVDRCDEAVRESVRASFGIGDHRTAVQDLDFLIDQLVEMAVRALSPGVNDPETAVACIHRLEATLVRVAGRRMPVGTRRDDEGHLRLSWRPTDFATIAQRCFDALRRYGAGEVSVVLALLHALRAAAGATAAPERHDVLALHAREIHDAFLASEPSSSRDREQVESAFRAVREDLASAFSRQGDG